MPVQPEASAAAVIRALVQVFMATHLVLRTGGGAPDHDHNRGAREYGRDLASGDGTPIGLYVNDIRGENM
jgi:hypothetical protein